VRPPVGRLFHKVPTVFAVPRDIDMLIVIPANAKDTVKAQIQSDELHALSIKTRLS
jgi:hypothetical protein